MIVYEFISMVMAIYSVVGFTFFNGELPLLFFALGWMAGYILATSIGRIYNE